MEKKLKSCLLSFNIKGVDDKEGIVQFYAAAFGTKGSDKDSDGDVIVKGAFKKTLNEQKGRIKHLLNHNPYNVPGVIKDAKEDDKGLLITSQLAKNEKGEYSTLAKDTMINYQAGVITEHSIGFRSIKEDYDESEQANFIKEVKLWEVSSLTHWGANQNTPFVGMKSENDLTSLLNQLKAIDKVLRSSNISDEGAKQLHKYSKRINIFLKSLVAVTDTTQPNTNNVDTSKSASIDFKFLTENFKL